MLSTALDLFRFIRAFQSDRIVPATLRRQALTPNSGEFGYGWQITTFFGREVQDFTGGTNGFAANVSYYPADNLTVVVLSNIENAGAKSLSCDIGALMHRETPRNGMVSFGSVPVTRFGSIVGTYIDDRGVQRRIAQTNGVFTYQSATSPSPQQLIAAGPDSLALAEHPDRLRRFPRWALYPRQLLRNPVVRSQSDYFRN
jgi:CubicO group peptidase (beta-lactamase class C family)